MKLLRKIVAYTLLSFLGSLLVLILLAELSENTITKLALNRINDGLDASIQVDNVDFSLLKDLPYAMVELKGVAITKDTDTLARVDHIFVSAEIMPLLDMQFNIEKVAVEGGRANYKVNSDHSTNFDVFLAVPGETEETDTSATSIYLSLKELTLNNLFLSYRDDASDVNACMYIDESEISVKMDDVTQKATFKGHLRANNCHYPDTKIKLMQGLNVDLDVEYQDQLITINDAYIETDGIKIKASGVVKNDSSLYTDLSIASSQFDLGELKKYIPDSLMKAYDVKQLSGIAAVQAKIKGTYNDSVMPSINASLQLKEGYVAMAGYPIVDKIQLACNYTNGQLQSNASTQVQIDSMYFKSGESWVQCSGFIKNLDAINYDIKSNAFVKLNEFKDYMPDSLVKQVDGGIEIAIETYGTVPQNFTEQFTEDVLDRTTLKVGLVDLALEMDSLIELQKWNGQLSYSKKAFEVEGLSGRIPTYGLELANSSLRGNYAGSISKLDQIRINLEDFDIATKESRLTGNLQLSNLDHPDYRIDCNAVCKLKEFMAFAPDELVGNMDGTLKAYLNSYGTVHLDSIADQAMAILFNQSVLKTEMDNVELDIIDPQLSITKLSGQIQMKSDSITIDNVSGDVSGLTFEADSTQLVNFYNAFWLNNPDTIKADGYFNFGDVDYTFFEPFMTEESVGEKTVEEPSEPAKYQFQAKGKITAKSFWYGNALLKNLSALYNVSDSLYIADQIKFDAFKGRTNSSVKVQKLPDDVMKIYFKNSTSGLDVNQLLYDFDDFMDYTEEVYISHEQLSGAFSTDNLNGEITFYGDSLDMNSILMSAELKLENGRLANYGIAEEMGRDYSIDGLDDIRFKTLDTKIFVYGGSIYAPLTNIKTNTFDISLFGKQEFDLDCQYHLRFYLKEILRKGKTNRLEKKQAKKENQDSRYGGTKGLTSLYAIYKVDDGKTVKSTLEGKDSKARNEMRRTVKVEEASLRLIFHPRTFKFNTNMTSN